MSQPLLESERETVDRRYYRRHRGARRAEALARYHANSDSINARLRANPSPSRNRRNKAVIQNYKKTHPCVDCGETDPVVLEFDHRSKADKLFTIGAQGGNKPEAVLLAEIAKCDVRCANCHRRKTVREKEYFRKGIRQ